MIRDLLTASVEIRSDSERSRRVPRGGSQLPKYGWEAEEIQNEVLNRELQCGLRRYGVSDSSRPSLLILSLSLSLSHLQSFDHFVTVRKTVIIFINKYCLSFFGIQQYNNNNSYTSKEKLIICRIRANVGDVVSKMTVNHIRGVSNKNPDFFVQVFKIVVDSWKFSMLLLYILWDDWPVFMLSGSNEQL